MTDPMAPKAYGVLIEPATLKIERLLPGPIERVWAFLTESDLRRQWLAAGTMDMKVGSSVEFVWRNDELTKVPGERPPGFPKEHRRTCRITELDPPRKLVMSWGTAGDVAITLEPKGCEVLLTLIHRRLPDRKTLVNVSAGWHSHLDLLVARATGREPASFWDGWRRLKTEYEGRIPA